MEWIGKEEESLVVVNGDQNSQEIMNRRWVINSLAVIYLILPSLSNRYEFSR